MIRLHIRRTWRWRPGFLWREWLTGAWRWARLCVEIEKGHKRPMLTLRDYEDHFKQTGEW